MPVKVTTPFIVECASAQEKQRVETVLYRSFLALYPLPEGFGWCGCGDHGATEEHSHKRRKVEEVWFRFFFFGNLLLTLCIFLSHF